MLYKFCFYQEFEKADVVGINEREWSLTPQFFDHRLHRLKGYSRLRS